MQKKIIKHNIIILYFCTLFLLLIECKLIRIREKRQLNPYIQYSTFASQYPGSNLGMYSNLMNPCINFDNGCSEEYFDPQRVAGNIMGIPGVSPIWPSMFLHAEPQQNPGYQFYWPYNYQQPIPSFPSAQPTNNEPQITPNEQVNSESKNYLEGSRTATDPTVINPETSSYSRQIDHVQNDPVKHDYQVVKSSSSVTYPKTVSVVRSFTDSQQAPEISIREENPSQTPTEEKNEPADSNPSKGENREGGEDQELPQNINGNQEENSQESQQNIQRQENNNEIRKKGKNRKPQNQQSNNEDNEDEFYYHQYLH